MNNLQQLISTLAKLAPHSDAMEWDNVGLQVGNYNSKIRRVMVTLDINEKVLKEAIQADIDLIISHHPLIFNGLDNIHNQTAKGRIIIKAIKNNIAIYSTHTNMDMAKGGLNDLLAEKLSITNTEILSRQKETKLYKLAVYVPIKYSEKIKKTLFKKGAGHIGDYSNTSFSIQGEGTFLPGENTDPYTGKKGNLEKVKEVKIETVVFENKIDNVIKAMLKVHPYEEVAYDLYRLPQQSKYRGMGRIGFLQRKINLEKYCEKIKDILDIKKLKIRGNMDDNIHKVALCSGAGADYISLSKAKGADLYITGDVKYHEAQLAEELDLNLIDAGHFETEEIFKELAFNYLQKAKNKDRLKIEIIKSKIKTNPWTYY
ncbi:MAG: Nif3-like dinuclear metal center hexameric protein [Halanaerobiales bacterium]|nr:Nif3-like dinuclear metal center hexameric protein [Halanaerobiales bacterium]